MSFLISAPEFETISTQVYDRSDASLDADPLLGVKPELLGDFRRAGSGAEAHWTLDFTFVMARRPRR